MSYASEGPRGRGNISRWSIEHPYVVIAFYLGVALLSVLAIFFQMPRRMMPYVESPMVAVVSMMPGSRPRRWRSTSPSPSRSGWWI